MNILTTKTLSDYQIDPIRGFLPPDDPLERLPGTFDAWERAAANVPALLLTGRLRETLERLPLLSIERLEDERQQQRAMLLLSVFGNGYVWGGESPAASIPRGVAVPWWALSERLGRPPIAAHASIVLNNWRRIDPDGPLDLSNIAAQQMFLGGLDEQWFYLTTVMVEAEGALALPILLDLQENVVRGQAAEVAQNLEKIGAILGKMYGVLLRIPEKCDPYIFFHRVRPFLAGWPEPGVIYEGVSSAPQKFAGGSAAQSSLIQALDAGLGVPHRDLETRPFLMKMRTYMPPRHCEFIEALEQGASVRQFVVERQASHPMLTTRYNTCISGLTAFRRKHMEIAVRYISHQAASPEEAKGTGGTNFTTFLGRTSRETGEQTIR